MADVRLEEFVYEKLEKKAPTRMNNHELLGQSMMEAGNEFGPGTAYGGKYTKLHDKQKLEHKAIIVASNYYFCILGSVLM